MTQMQTGRLPAIVAAITAATFTGFAAHAQIMGACCLPDNTCIEVIDFECFGQGGVFNPGQICADVDCINGPTGACCSDDPATGGVICQENAFEADCLALPGGTFFRGQTCDQIPCSNVGACCLADGVCQDNVFFADCLGEFIPNGSCADNPCFVPVDGACCFPDASCIDHYPEDFCFLDGGRFSPGGLCADPDACTFPIFGACCIGDTVCIEESTPDDCASRGGTFFEGAICFNLPCAPIPDPGACCLPDGSCAELIEINCVEEENGVFQGEGTTCGPDACSAPPCPCELDGNPAQLDVFDLLVYLNLWFASNPAADLDETGGVDVFDLLLYLGCWFTGCP